MTKQEAIKNLQFMRDAIERGDWICSNDNEALDMAMEALSAQTEIIRCKDCIYQTESWSEIKYCEAHGDHIGKDYDYCSNARRKDNG